MMFYLIWNLPTPRYAVFNPETLDITWSVHKEKATMLYQNEAEHYLKTLPGQDVKAIYGGINEEVRVPVA
jgi:hypothetical protein